MCGPGLFKKNHAYIEERKGYETGSNRAAKGRTAPKNAEQSRKRPNKAEKGRTEPKKAEQGRKNKFLILFGLFRLSAHFTHVELHIHELKRELNFFQKWIIRNRRASKN